MSVDIPPAVEALAIELGDYVFRDEAVLGTRLQLNLVARSFAAARAAAKAVRGEIDRLNLIFNSRDATSELSQLNRSEKHIASPELFAVVAAAEQWRVATGGAYSGRLGRLLTLWQLAQDELPERTTLLQLAQQADRARVELDPHTHTITRPVEVVFALDALAKGWIVDRAFEIAMASPGVTGALIDIGGDIRCGGQAPGPNGWCVGISDPQLPFDNAPLVATTQLSNHGIATSGRGPRDRVIKGVSYSPTLSPFDGWPVNHNVAASVVATSAATADALATALLVLPSDQALALARKHAVPARLTIADANGGASDGNVVWHQLKQSTTSVARFTAIQSTASTPVSGSIAEASVGQSIWPENWQALATFTAPRRQLICDPDFRSPYMAMWITDIDNRPIRTLILIGKRTEWQKDNFIWWSMNRNTTERMISTRSMSTSGAGVYNVFWDGVDDLGQRVAAGKYVLHVETSREHGKHTYRSLQLDFARTSRFVDVLDPTEEGGGLRVSFDHY